MIIDEGLAFNPERGTDRVLLVADETGLPAIASICASLPADATGLAIIEVPSTEDALEFEQPAGSRFAGSSAMPRQARRAGARTRLTALTAEELPGSRSTPTSSASRRSRPSARRHLVADRGLEKDLVSFCGYWRVGAASPTPKSQVAASTEAHA